MTVNDGSHLTLARKEAISNARPERHSALRQAAENLSLRNVDAAVCELMNEALTKLVHLLYEEDAGCLYNVDQSTGRILIPLPWGKAGYKRWSIYPTESVILREILFGWEQEADTLLRYDRSRRSWFVDLVNYANFHLAKQWLVNHQVTVPLYRDARNKRAPGNNPEKNRRQRARQFNAKGTHTKEDIERQYAAQKGQCYFCRRDVGDGYEVEHLVPLSRGGTDDPSNLVIACPDCNRQKGTKLPHEWSPGGRLL